ncbi:MAG: helix-turn-helix domain-containing protein [Chloroflexota bacterium]|nr:helix-turn-helix domain-containing protein [Chloroflexota bacterium]
MVKKTDTGRSSSIGNAKIDIAGRSALTAVNVGPRIRALRLRYGLSLREVSHRTGLGYAVLGRLEHGDTTGQQLKPGILHTILDEIGVTEQERRAVFFRESRPLAGESIRDEVSKVAAKIEEGHRPVALLDEHMRWLYLNRSGRLLFGLTGEEYVRLLGSYMILDLVNPSAPLYSRYLDDMRRIYFSWKVTSFKLRFAEQQFCQWYLDLEATISTVAWAWRIWNKPQVLPTLVDSHETTMLHPEVGEMHLRDQLNVQTLSFRFLIMEWAPTDEVSAAKAATVVSRPYWLPPVDADSTTTPDQDTGLANTPTSPATSHMERRARESSPSKRPPGKSGNQPPAGEVEPKTFAEGTAQEETRPRLRSSKKELVH